MSKGGRFIVIDGLDGAGKETQAKLLVERLTKEGFTVHAADFPQYGKPSAHFVERYLRGEYGQLHEVSAQRASLFYALDRFEASFQIRQWLEEGAIVVSNRYVSANKGHQLAKVDTPSKMHETLEWLNNLEYGIMGIPVPDVTILLHMSADIGQRLVDTKKPRPYTMGAARDLHEADIEYLRKSEQAFLFCIEHDQKEKWKRVICFENDQPRPREAIHEEVYQLAKEGLDNNH